MSKDALEMDDPAGIALAKLEAAAGFQALDTDGKVHLHADASGMEVLDAAGVAHFKVASTDARTLDLSTHTARERDALPWLALPWCRGPRV